MSTRNDYWAYLQPSSSDIKHYGVKGMKWGVRNDYVPTGRYRYIHRHRATDSAPRSRTTSQVSRSTPQQRRAANRVKIAKGLAIAGGLALASHGGYHAIRILSSPSGKQAIARGKLAIENRVFDAMYKTRNVRNITRQVVRTPIRMAKASPVGRVANTVLSAPRKVLGGSAAGAIALKAYGAATLASDINSTQQWVRKVHAKKKVTGGDVKDLAKDLINPIPDNIPLVNKRAREERRKKRKGK